MVLSLLTSEEDQDLNLENEAVTCEKNAIRLYRLPIMDRSIPRSVREVEGIIDKVRRDLDRGLNVNIHCRQGIGRAAMIAAALLIEKGILPDQAIERIAKARGVPVPETHHQRAWIDQFAASPKR